MSMKIDHSKLAKRLHSGRVKHGINERQSRNGRPEWWQDPRFKNENIRDSAHAKQLLETMLRKLRTSYPTESDTKLRQRIAERLELSLRTVANWTKDA